MAGRPQPQRPAFAVGGADPVRGLLFVPLLPGEFWIYVATEILILGLFAMSFNLLHGYMGQISFGHAAFFGLGAYATALLMRFFKGGGIADMGYLEFFPRCSRGRRSRQRARWSWATSACGSRASTSPS